MISASPSCRFFLLGALLLDRRIQFLQTAGDGGNPAGGLDVAGPQQGGAEKCLARIEQKRARGQRVDGRLLLRVLEQLTALLELRPKRRLAGVVARPTAAGQQQDEQQPDAAPPAIATATTANHSATARASRYG